MDEQPNLCVRLLFNDGVVSTRHFLQFDTVEDRLAASRVFSRAGRDTPELVHLILSSILPHDDILARLRSEPSLQALREGTPKAQALFAELPPHTVTRKPIPYSWTVSWAVVDFKLTTEEAEESAVWP